VTSREERNTLDNLADLAASDLNEQTDEVLVAGYHDAVRSAEISAEACRRILGVLRERHSWTELVRLTGDPQTTLYNRANPRRKQRESE
jgi:hypothetical protein